MMTLLAAPAALLVFCLRRVPFAYVLCSLSHGDSLLAVLIAFSHLQFSQIRGRQPYSIVRNIPYVIRQGQRASAIRVRSKGPCRHWKGFDWDALERLYQKGLIANPANKAKSVVLSDEGLRRAEKLFHELFTRPAP
jgi:Domain of unknown function (DUF6429)